MTAQWTPAGPPGPPGVRSMTEAEARANLAEGLRFAVPLHIAEIRDRPAEQRRFYLPPGGLEALGMADAIMFKTSRWQNTARSFDAYARALAILAYEPGGVTLFGVHWCATEHDGCPYDWTSRRPWWEPLDDRRPWWAPLDDLATLIASEQAT